MRSISLPLPRQFRTDEGGKLEITVVIGENPLSLSLPLSSYCQRNAIEALQGASRLPRSRVSLGNGAEQVLSE